MLRTPLTQGKSHRGGIPPPSPSHPQHHLSQRPAPTPPPPAATSFRCTTPSGRTGRDQQCADPIHAGRERGERGHGSVGTPPMPTGGHRWGCLVAAALWMGPLPSGFYRGASGSSLEWVASYRERAPPPRARTATWHGHPAATQLEGGRRARILEQYDVQRSTTSGSWLRLMWCPARPFSGQARKP